MRLDAFSDLVAKVIEYVCVDEDHILFSYLPRIMYCIM